jgi:phospholipase/lecithinase/hemolysin
LQSCQKNGFADESGENSEQTIGRHAAKLIDDPARDKPTVFCQACKNFATAFWPLKKLTPPVLPRTLFRMAKKADAESTAKTPRRRVEKQNSDAGKSDSLRASASLRLKSSSLLDTRVVYCGGPCRTGQGWGLAREITPRAASPHANRIYACMDIKTRLPWIFMALLCFSEIDAARATVLVSASLTQTAAGSPNSYGITLNNSSTAGETVSTFWLSWTPGQNYMNVAPTGITVPTGWTYSITHAGANDGYGIQFSTSTSPLSAENILQGFSFQSTSSITQLQGNSVYYPTNPVLTSVAFTGGGSVKTTFISTFQAKLIIFGDSYSDVGNSYNDGVIFLGSPIAPPNYTLGRYTDGPDTTPNTSMVGNWADQLAALLGIPDPKPSTAGGGDYAYGGAPTGSNTSPPGMSNQISLFLRQFPTPLTNSIYALWGGGIDLIDAAMADTSLPAAETNAINNLKAEIGELATAGARNFIWFDLQPIGSIPAEVSSGNAAALNSASAQFRNDMSLAISQLEASYPGITIRGVDDYTLMSQIIANPSAYGFTNATGTSQTNAVNPDKYLFWDIEHLTTVGHRLVANLVFNEIAPHLTLVPSSDNVVLTWPTNATGFTLQSTTNLVSSTVWTTVSPTPTVVNTNNAVTNPISGTQKFFRLSQ